MRPVQLLSAVGVLSIGLAATLHAGGQQSTAKPQSMDFSKSVREGRVTQPHDSARVLPGTRLDIVNTTIRGNALSSTNGQLSDAGIQLRNARTGRIVDTTITDRAGLFEFRNVDPGSYVVELIDTDRSVLAASELLNINAGEAVSAVVKLPFRVPPFAAVLGHTSRAALILTTTAAASGVLAAEVAGEPASPRR